MIDKIGPPIAKVFSPITKLIGKNHSKKEKVIGVVFRDKYVQAAEVSFKKGICKVSISKYGRINHKTFHGSYLQNSPKIFLTSLP